jgi:hypothetical protein
MADRREENFGADNHTVRSWTSFRMDVKDQSSLFREPFFMLTVNTSMLPL